MAAVDEATGEVTAPENRKLGQVRTKSFRTFAPGDVLFAKITPCMENGKSAVVSNDATDLGFGSTEFHVLRPNAGVNPHFIWHFVRQRSFRRTAEEHMTGSVGQLRVPADFLKNFSIYLPAEPVQDEIIHILDSGIASTQSATKHLAAARTVIERLRQIVLAAACSGRLTADWREGKTRETAAEFLEDVYHRRESVLGRKGEKATASANYGFEVPTGWGVTSLDRLSVRITSGSRDWSRFYGHGSGTFVMAQNVRQGYLDWSFRQPVDPPEHDTSRERSRIAVGDLLVTIVGANTGDVGPVTEDRPEHYVCQSVALVRPARAELGPFLNLWFNSPEHGRGYFEECIYGAGRPHLSFDQLKAAPIAVPPLAEQEEIVHRVEALMKLTDGLLDRIKLASRAVDRSSQALLAKAFRGELLPVGADLRAVSKEA